MSQEPLSPAIVKERLALACHWLTDIAQVRDDAEITPAQRRRHAQPAWTGAMRGEYALKKGEWGFFCPVWHTGQAIKALAMAADSVGDQALEGARRGAEFLLANQVAEGPDAGLLLAFEDFPERINTSAQLEALDGLFVLAEKTGETRWRDAALRCLDWVADHAYFAGEGLFQDLYDPARREFVTERHWGRGRPLLDDGVFITGWKLTGNERYLTIARETADRLLKDEDPAGNWLGYAPCLRYQRSIHPRQAFWWGKPMVDLFDATGDARYVFAFQRAIAWYRAALRTDGCVFRDTRSDFRTASFNHVTSASACAARLFLRAQRDYRDRDLRPDTERALEFCLKMQFTAPQDPNVRGAFIEGVTPPDGTDASPYHIRDLATIFSIQALVEWLRLEA